MPTNLTDVDEFTTVTGPLGTDIRNSASVRSALQTLANRTRFLFNRAVSPQESGFRLTGTTADPVVDTATPGTIYFTPYLSNRIAIYDGSAWVQRASAEVSLALSGLTTDTNYDVFAQWTGSALAIALTAWSNDTTRSTGIVRQDGVWVKSGTLTDRYVGTIRTIATNQTADSVTRRFIWNAVNRVRRHLSVTEATNNWTYSNPNGVWRQANASTSNKFEIVVGLPVALLEAQVSAEGISDNANGLGVARVGVGLGSTTVNSAQIFGSYALASNQRYYLAALYKGQATLGYTAVNWLESGTVNTLNYTFGAGVTPGPTMGMTGSVEA